MKQIKLKEITQYAHHEESMEGNDTTRAVNILIVDRLVTENKALNA